MQAEVRRPEVSKENLPENVMRIEKPEGIYRLVLSGSHNKEEPAAAVIGSDAVILESIFDYSDPIKVAGVMGNIAKSHVQYKDIGQWCKDNEKPVFFTDIQESYLIARLQEALRGAEFGVAAFLLIRLSRKIAKNKPISRRQLLQLPLSTYLATPFIEDILKTTSPSGPKRSGLVKLGHNLGQLDEVIHPEVSSVLVTLRNHLMAQKWKTIMHIVGSENKINPEVSQIIGAEHTNIITAIDKPDKQVAEIIDKILSITRLSAEREKISAIARADWDKETGAWRVREYSDPVLRPLEHGMPYSDELQPK